MTTTAKVPTRVRSAKTRCRKVISMLPANGPIGEDAVTRAILELDKASHELQTELQAMKVQRARAAARCRRSRCSTSSEVLTAPSSRRPHRPLT